MLRHDDIRGMLRALKAGGAVWYAPDQNYRHKGSIIADFFGVPAPTNPATTRLASMGKASVVPFSAHRKRDGSGYVLEVLPPLEGFPGESPEEDARRINAIIETQVRDYPEEYFWVHRRFRTTSRREEDVYA